IDEGEIIRIDTRTGEYMERVNKITPEDFIWIKFLI
ncbi:MAG: hypothetical protein K2H66_01050, partial [Oscillospiraceae bacterium]|nr:hypothetical protein [Oscillospiraceae bacterium]